MRHFNFISYFTLHKNDKCGKDRSESNEIHWKTPVPKACNSILKKRP